jgi:ABC-2 type transport system permease protein
LSVASYVGLGSFFGARLARRTEDATGPIAAVGVPLLVLGGTFFPTSILPKYLLAVAYADPVFHMNEALRGVSAKAATLADVHLHVIFLFAFTVFPLMLGVNSYKKMLRQEKHARSTSPENRKARKIVRRPAGSPRSELCRCCE